jgi:hypothetical protein
MSKFDELAKTLDSYLEGNWRKIDYELNNARTEIIEYPENRLLVAFGDGNTKKWYKPRLLLKYEKENDGFRIVEVEKINTESLAYSNEVIQLLQGYLIK